MLDGLLLAVCVAMGAAGAWRVTTGRTRRTVAAACVAGMVAAGVGVWKLSSVRAAVLGPAVLSYPVDQPLVALTFDDGPTPAYTKPVLDLLETYDARATFFVTGHELTAHPELGRQILAAGHELGNHSWSHPRLVFRSTEDVREEIERTDDAIRAVGQAGTPAFRPPYFKRLLTVHQVLGDRPAVLASIDADPRPDTAEAIAARVLARVRPGDIVLLHVSYASRQSSRDALPLILEGLAEQGLQPVSLATLQRHARDYRVSRSSTR